MNRADSPEPQDSGFVLVAVLLAVAAIASLTVALTQRATLGASMAAVQASIVEARAAASAGQVRILAAIQDREDPLHTVASPYSPPIKWKLGTATVTLRVQAESGKIDVLVGDIALIQSILNAVFADKTIVEESLQIIKELRTRNLLPERLLGILPLRGRLLPESSLLSDHLTIFSAQTGIDPLAASSLVRDALADQHPNLKADLIESVSGGRITSNLAAALGQTIVPQRPIYMIEAEAVLANGVRVRKVALIRVDLTGGAIATIERNAFVPPRP